MMDPQWFPVRHESIPFWREAGPDAGGDTATDVATDVPLDLTPEVALPDVPDAPPEVLSVPVGVTACCLSQAAGRMAWAEDGDIFFYDLATASKALLQPSVGIQTDPVLVGDRLVWSDDSGGDFEQASEMRMEDLERRQSLWRWILIAAFTLFVTETLLSNWVSRKTGAVGVATG